MIASPKYTWCTLTGNPFVPPRQVSDALARLWVHDLHHHADYFLRRAELSIAPQRAQFIQQILMQIALCILILQSDLHLCRTDCTPLSRVLVIIESLQKQQIRKLLNRIQRIGKSPRPELFPEGVCLRAEFRVGEHGLIIRGSCG